MKTRGDSNDQTFQDASSQLNEGLRSCRAVVSGYRTLLSGEGGEEPEQVAFNDAGDVAEEAAA